MYSYAILPYSKSLGARITRTSGPSLGTTVLYLPRLAATYQAWPLIPSGHYRTAPRRYEQSGFFSLMTTSDNAALFGDVAASGRFSATPGLRKVYGQLLQGLITASDVRVAVFYSYICIPPLMTPHLIVEHAARNENSRASDHP